MTLRSVTRPAGERMEMMTLSDILGGWVTISEGHWVTLSEMDLDRVTGGMQPWKVWNVAGYK